MKKSQRRLRWVSILWALAITLLAESPSVLFIENAARIWTTQEINRVGILCIVRFVLMAMVSFALGLLLFLRLHNSVVVISTSDFQVAERRNKNRYSYLIAGLILALLPLFSLTEPVINLFTQRNLEAELVEAYWTWLFLVAAAVIFIVAFSLLQFILPKHIRYEVDETLPESGKKSN